MSQKEIGKIGVLVQKFYDNPWILLVLGILIPFLSYTVWGWVELSMIEPAQLP